MVVLTVLCVTPIMTMAYDEVTEISITVGFWGEDGYVKTKVSLSDLAGACGTHQELYTWINRGSSPGITEAEGIYISDVMDYCGIDSSAIYYYNFHTTDAATYANSNQQWTKDQLFGSRYSYAECFMTALGDYESDPEDYMAYPESHYTIDDFFDFKERKYTKEAWNNRYRVEPMLALKTRSTKWSSYVPASKLDFSHLNNGGRPILMFGQAGRNDITRDLMAQMVDSIHIWFNGHPDIDLESEDTSGKVGDAKQYHVSVDTPDDYLTEEVKKRLIVKSSNEDVAKADQDGNITITGKGTAQITVEYNSMTYDSITITGNADESGSGNGSGTSSGEGNGSSKGDSEDNGSGEGSMSDSKSSGKNASKGESSESAEKIQQVNRASAQQESSKTQTGSAGGAASGSGDDNVKVYKISEAEDTYIQSTISKKLIYALWAAGWSLLILGAVIETAYFRGQIYWADKMRRKYKHYE